ncbi:MAG: hypothetical protein V2A73_01705 [Pseudomonadota bacterium]
MPKRTGAEKPKLTQDEATRFRLTALQAGRAGDDDGILAAATVTLGLRSSEYMSCLGKHVDCGGNVLHYRDAKTGRWLTVDVHDPSLAELLVDLASRRGPDQSLWRPSTDVRNFPARVVKRYCKLAGVTEIGCQQMRATVDSLGVLDLAQVVGTRHTAKVAIKNYIGRETMKQAKLATVAGKLGIETQQFPSQASDGVASPQNLEGSGGPSA